MFSSRSNRKIVLPPDRLQGNPKRGADASYPEDIGKEPSEERRKTLRPQRKRMGGPLVQREKSN